jgi:alkyl hydroperoxide reductase subunit F
VSSPDRSAAIRDILLALTSPVRLLFFEQSIGCDSCVSTRQLLEQLADLSPNLTVERLNLVLEQDRSAQYGVDRVPAIVVSSPRRERIHFYGAPLGHELMSLLDAIRMTSAVDSGLTGPSRAQLTAVKGPVRIQVFYTPTCVYCAQMVTLANRLAIESPQITATAINATEYPDGCATNVNGTEDDHQRHHREVGAVTEEDLVRRVLAC